MVVMDDSVSSVQACRAITSRARAGDSRLFTCQLRLGSSGLNSSTFRIWMSRTAVNAMQEIGEGVIRGCHRRYVEARDRG